MTAPSSTPDGHLLPFGRRTSDGRMVHVSQVPSGLACGCTCPGCGARLVARKGGVVSHHFAHASSEGCSTGRETALHLMGKQVLLDGRTLIVPPPPMSGRQALNLEYEQVWQEVPLGHGKGSIKPDIVIRRGGVVLMVEIAVTHRSTEEKRLWLVEHGRNAIEIDLSGLAGRNGLTLEDVEQAVRSDAPRRWVHHRSLLEREEQAQALRNSRIYGGARPGPAIEPGPAPGPRMEEWASRPTRSGLPDSDVARRYAAQLNCLPEASAGTSLRVPRSHVACLILESLVRQPHESWTPGRFLEMAREHGMTKAACVVPLGSPGAGQEVEGILRHLERHRLLERTKAWVIPGARLGRI